MFGQNVSNRRHSNATPANPRATLDASGTSGTVSVCENNEGAICFLPGAYVFAGYRIAATVAGQTGLLYNFVNGVVQLPVSCSAGGSVVGRINITLSQSYITLGAVGTYLPATTTALAYQGSTTAPNFCSGAVMCSSSTVGCVSFTGQIKSFTGQGSMYKVNIKFRYRVPASLSGTSTTASAADGGMTSGAVQISSATLFGAGMRYDSTGTQYLVSRNDAGAGIASGASIASGSFVFPQTVSMSAAATVTATNARFTVTRNVNCLNSGDPLYLGTDCTGATLGTAVLTYPVPSFCLVDNPINHDPLKGPCKSLVQDAGCNAKDVKIAQVVNLGTQRTCTVGEMLNLQLRATFVATSNERYNVAAYFAVDGGNAQCGSCFPFNLSPVGSPVNLCNDNALNCSGPYTDLDKDLCGDLNQNEYTLEDRFVEFVCRDEDSNGQADVLSCTSWDNQGTDKGNGIPCVSIHTAGAGTTAKCNCEKVNIIGLQPGGMGSRETHNVLRILGPAICRHPDIFTEVACDILRIVHALRDFPKRHPIISSVQTSHLS